VTTPPQTRVPEDGRTAVEAINVESAGRLISSGQQLVLCGRGRRGWSLALAVTLGGGGRAGQLVSWERPREGGGVGLQLQPRARGLFSCARFSLAPFGWPRWRRGCVVLLLPFPSSPPGRRGPGGAHACGARGESTRCRVPRSLAVVAARLASQGPSVRPSVRRSLTAVPPIRALAVLQCEGPRLPQLDDQSHGASNRELPSINPMGGCSNEPPSRARCMNIFGVM
jgi:hypothetical protein